MKMKVFSGLILMALSAIAFAGDNCPSLPKALRGNVSLPSGCVYKQAVKILQSDTTLDCNGSVFQGNQRDAGLYIDSKGQPLQNVTVKNCTFRNFKGGVRVGWSAKDTEKGSDHADIYRRTPTKITLDHLVVENNSGVGIYIDDYATHVTVKNSVVQQNDGVGIYLEHSSRNNTITQNRFLQNGNGKGPREAIAVDSSADNVIEDNDFQNNAAGGVFLYKNCGEHMNSGKQVTRWQHSDNNRIENNRFTNEKVGVWIASRQSRNMQKSACGDPSMDGHGQFFQDYANNNMVTGNQFAGDDIGVRIEGDNNQVTGNTFDCRGKTSIDLPHTKREQFLRLPQVGNVTSNNKQSGCR